MKRAGSASFIPRLVFSSFVFWFLVFFHQTPFASAQASHPCGARGQGTETAVGNETRPTARTTADESFDLDIPLRRITEEKFHAATDITAEAGNALCLRVGAVASAETIELLLRGVRGSVRFRASLGPVLRLLDARREARPSPDSSNDSSP